MVGTWARVVHILGTATRPDQAALAAWFAGPVPSNPRQYPGPQQRRFACPWNARAVQDQLSWPRQLRGCALPPRPFTPGHCWWATA